MVQEPIAPVEAPAKKEKPCKKILVSKEYKYENISFGSPDKTTSIAGFSSVLLQDLGVQNFHALLTSFAPVNPVTMQPFNLKSPSTVVWFCLGADKSGY